MKPCRSLIKRYRRISDFELLNILSNAFEVIEVKDLHIANCPRQYRQQSKAFVWNFDIQSQ